MSQALVKHRFLSSKPASADPLKVGAVPWNDSHKFEGGVHGSLLMRDTTDVNFGVAWLESAPSGRVLVSQGSGSAPAYTATPALTSLSLTTPLAAIYGGTGLNVYATGDILYANTTTTLARRAAVVDGNVLRSAGSGVAPIWGKVRLSGSTTDVTGTLDVDKGGTGTSSLTNFGVLYGKGTSPIAATAATNVDAVLFGSSGLAPVFSADPIINSFTGRAYLGLAAASGGGLRIQHATIKVFASSGVGFIAAGGIIPAGSLVMGVATRVKDQFGVSGGLTTLSIGDGTDVDRWGGGTSINAGTITDLRNVTDPIVRISTLLTDVVITADAGTFDASGSIVVTAYFINLIAPTS